MSIFLQDVRYAVRQLWKHPGFSLTSIFSLALGIAATVSVFSVIYSTLLHPSPYVEADRIVQINVFSKYDYTTTPHIYKEQIAELRKASFLEDLVEMDEQYLADMTVDIPQDVDAVYLSGNAFQFFGVPAMLGRTFLPSDAPEGRAPQPVVVLTHQYWQRRFNGNLAIVGQPLRLDGRSYTILGVMPAHFTWWDCDVYLPLDTSNAATLSYMTVMRLKPGVSKAQASAEIQPILDQMKREHPKDWSEGQMRVVGINDHVERALGKTLYLLFAAVLLLLVIGCVNVSILLLARGAARQHEFAVRAAVGASRWNILRQLLTESLILSFVGAFLGVLTTFRITPFVVALLPWQLFTRGLEIPVHIPVLIFSVVLAMFSSVLFGLFPAKQMIHAEISHVMQADSRKTAGSVSGKKLHAVLIAGQIALAMALITAAATAIQGFRTLLQADLGFDPQNVNDYSIPVHSGSYTTWDARANYFQQLRDRVAQTPGVLSVSLGLIGPPQSEWDFPVEILGRNALGSQVANINFVDPEFFRTLRIPLLEGRLWSETETNRGARLVVVNQAFVRRYFPEGDALGHSVRVLKLTGQPPRTLAVDDSSGWVQIIGVVGDARNDGLDSPVKPEIYFPYSYYMFDLVQIFVRAQSDPHALEASVRRQIASVNPGQQVTYPTITMPERIERQSEWAREHLVAILSSIFSVLALVLASVGLYSVVSYSVAQRIHEFGIRMALGAQRRHILQNVLAGAGISVGSGLVVGTILSLGLHDLLSLWVESTNSPATILAVCLLLVFVALLACIIPALRASFVQPMKALRLD